MQRVKKYAILFLFLFMTWSLSAQKGKHSLFFYPLTSNEVFETYTPPILIFTKPDPRSRIKTRIRKQFFPLKDFNPIMGLGYNYQFNEDWALDLRLYVHQKLGRLSDNPRIFSSTSKSMKFGFQYFYLNKKVQASFGFSYFFQTHDYYRSTTRISTADFIHYKENEYGLELGLGLAYRIAKKVRVYLGGAFRISRITEESIFTTINENAKVFIPFDSLGFGYTF